MSYIENMNKIAFNGKISKNIILALLFTFVYFVICIVIDINRVPFWDEARAWLIAQNCNILEYLDLMKLECHMFVWYLIIFPFAKLNLFYPYSMQFLNTVIASAAIYVLWRKAPFLIYEKILITFSVPFLFLWGVVARCYSIGILFIFLALMYYKLRFKHPYRYLVYLCLAMNTSVMAFVGAFYLALIFIVENFKNKNFIKLSLIFLGCILIVAIQDYAPNPDFLKQTPEMAFLRDFFGYILHPVFFIPQYAYQSILMSILRVSVDICCISFVVFSIKNNKKILSFILLTYLSLLIIFVLFYSGNFWHYFYFYFYFIVAFWILRIENKIPKVLNVFFIIILSCFMFKGSLFIDSKMTTINDSTSLKIAKEILSNPKYKNVKLFCLDPWSDIAPSSLPYLKGKVKIYDIFNRDRFSYKSMRSHIEFNTKSFNPDEFYKFVDNDSILLTTTAFTRHELKNPKRRFDEKSGIIDFVGENYTVSFIPLDAKEDICLWSYIIKVHKTIQK